MKKRKQIREKGKLRLSKIFQELKEGDKVTMVREHSVPATFPKRMQGRTGLVKGVRGKAYIVEIKDYDEAKTYIVEPIHLKKLK